MLLAHLHARCGNAPLRLLAANLKLVPLGAAQLARAHENQWRKPEGVGGARLPHVAVDCAQKLGDAFGLSDRSEVARGHRRERTTKVGGDVTLCPAGGNCEAEDAADSRAC